MPAALRRLGAALAAAGALVPLSAAPAGASQTLYVDNSLAGGLCSDLRSAEDNSQMTPWCTIGHALKAAPSGATVLVRRGTYGQVRAADVAPQEPITLRPHPGEQPVVAGMDVTGIQRLHVEGLRFSDGIVVRGGSELRFRGNLLALKPAGDRTSSGFILNTVRDVLLLGNVVRDGRDGVNIDGSRPASSEIAIVGNRFERLGNDAVHLTTGNHDILVSANEIVDCRPRADIDPDAHADAIQSAGPTQNVKVVGNHVRGGRGFLFFVSPRDVDEPGHAHEGLELLNNVIVGPDFGARLFSTTGARIVNNTFWGPTTRAGGGLDIRDAQGANARTTGMVVANNIVRRLDVVDSAAFARREANLVADGPRTGRDLAGAPDFVDAGRGDWRLRPGSRGVDAGDALLAPPTDFFGKGRLGAPDVGAFEVGGTTLPGTPLSAPAAAPSAPSEPAAPQDTAPPVIEAFERSPGRISERALATPLSDLTGESTLGVPGAATLAWRSSRPAWAFVRVDRRFRGVRRGGTCVRGKRKRGRRRCTGHEAEAMLLRASPAGLTTMALTARLGDEVLAPGRYRATLALLSRFNQASATRSVAFRVTVP